MKNNAPKKYTHSEELVNMLTHGAGAILSLAGLIIMVSFAWKTGSIRNVIAVGIYGSTMVLLYTSSTLYHAVRSRRLKRLFRLLDHCMIFLLIAGTYTPLTLISLYGLWGWTLFGLIWGLAVTGIVITILAMDKTKWLALGIYIGMGWLAIIAIKPLMAALSLPGLLWISAGGLLYSVGIVFYVWHRLPYNHAIWHLFVLGGTACHFVAILRYVLPG